MKIVLPNPASAASSFSSPDQPAGKILFTASIQLHMDTFHMPFLRWLHENGWEVHTAARGLEKETFIHHHNLPFCRSPLAAENGKAYRRLCALLEKEHFDIIHCHTPMASVLTRLAARKTRGAGTKVLYTAHGFHFYKGAGLVAKTLYKAVEKWLAHYTDCLILINNEDYEAAQHFAVPQVVLTHGVGVDPDRFTPQTLENKKQARQALDIPEDAFVLLYPAELTANKNHQLLLEIVAAIGECIPNLLLLLPGGGPEEVNLQYFIYGLGIIDKVRIMNFRPDMETLYHAADLDVTTSRREGLSTHLIEALTTGLPVVASNIRGHRDLVVSGENGFLFTPGDIQEAAHAIIGLYEDKTLYNDLCQNARDSVHPFHLANTLAEMREIYRVVIAQRKDASSPKPAPDDETPVAIVSGKEGTPLSVPAEAAVQ